MAEHQTGPVELGAPMDYNEHQKTYSLFLSSFKYGTLFVAALLLGMLSGLIAGAGFLAGILTFLIVLVVGLFVLR
ncbi:aa3-type cytochrome c oxidase subunit IV [Oryzifoliimicrobium ureilyticus]|uniref:aa3-type cytochrome c oxidase subunit IV n=1 Tax=Oryzifoliimicrobium ureilyticus TaxID=3113724 RepID=UPI0030760707